MTCGQCVYCPDYKIPDGVSPYHYMVECQYPTPMWDGWTARHINRFYPAEWCRCFKNKEPRHD